MVSFKVINNWLSAFRAESNHRFYCSMSIGR
jgi:hypothetical protein